MRSKIVFSNLPVAIIIVPNSKYGIIMNTNKTILGLEFRLDILNNLNWNS